MSVGIKRGSQYELALEERYSRIWTRPSAGVGAIIGTTVTMPATQDHKIRQIQKKKSVKVTLPPR
jgi:hypothetical protein